MAKNLYETLGKYTPDGLIAGQEVGVLISGVSLKASQGVLTRGTVVGVITLTGKAVPVDKAATDGSQVPYGILTDDMDTSSETEVTVYTSGVFNKNALIFAEGNTVADHEPKLRELGIYLKSVK